MFVRSSGLALALLAGCLAIPSGAFAAGAAQAPGICARPCWAARAPKANPANMATLNRAIVHHTAGSEFNTTGLAASQANVRAIQNYHMNTQGWNDIGYHFLVDKFGNVFEGCHGAIPSWPRGAHDATNTNSFGFNVMGYFHPGVNNIPTNMMMGRLYDVIAWKMPGAWQPYGWPGSAYGSLGNQVGYVDAHRRVKSTACPGDHVFNPYMGSNINGGVIRREIVLRTNGTLRGNIKDKYASFGGVISFLGEPITGENTCPDGVGKYNHFANGCSIYWTGATGAWYVGGSIRAKWEQLNWENGVCGYPTTDETATPSGVGRYNHFSKGSSIYWSPSTGAHQVGGAIRNHWSSIGWENSSLGYPTSD